MRKLSATIFVALISLSLLAGQSARTASAKPESVAPANTETVTQPIIAEPQTRCEGGLVSVQFKGEQAEWYRTKKTCGPLSTDQKVCCCGMKEYDSSTHHCSSGKLYDKSTGHQVK